MKRKRPLHFSCILLLLLAASCVSTPAPTPVPEPAPTPEPVAVVSPEPVAPVAPEPAPVVVPAGPSKEEVDKAIAEMERLYSLVMGARVAEFLPEDTEKADASYKEAVKPYEDKDAQAALERVLGVQAAMKDLIDRALPLFADSAAVARKEAFDLGLKDSAPDDYRGAEENFLSGKTAGDQSDAQSALPAYRVAIDLFKQLTEKGLVSSASDGKTNALKMKKAALDAEAAIRCPERLAAGDGAIDAAESAIATGDYRGAIASYMRSLRFFEIAYKASRAQAMRDRIAEYDLSRWDSGNYSLAEGRFAEAGALADQGSDESIVAAVDALDEALLRYNLVFEKGREMTASGKKDRTDQARSLADGIKAAVAVKDLYAVALAKYLEAQDLLAAKDYEAASAAFDEAERLFSELYKVAADKRAKAEAALLDAAQREAEARKAAEDAAQTLQAQQ